MRLTEYERDSLIGSIENALQQMYTNDIELVTRGGMERSLTFRFGLYFSQELTNINMTNFLALDVDLEYNKNGLNPKRTPRRPNGVRPDLILHKRGDNEKNCCVIEIKGWWNRKNRSFDLEKLEDFTAQQGEYCYGLGVFIELFKDRYELYQVSDYVMNS